MPRCPKCKCIYNDETQIFCTNDGLRLLHPDQDTGEIPITDSSRRTPVGELLFETFVSPPSNSSVKKVVSSKGKPSFQMFGLHSSNASGAQQETKSTNGFHSFDYLIVKENETKPEQPQPLPKSNETSQNKSVIDSEPEKKRKFGSSFVLFCLLSALIFLTCLAFVANYFFRE